MTRETALKARGLAQHRAMAKRQARPSSVSDVLSPVAGSPATSASAPASDDAPAVPTSTQTSPAAPVTPSSSSVPAVESSSTSSTISETSSILPTTSSSSSVATLSTSSTLPLTSTTSTTASLATTSSSISAPVSLSRSTTTIGQSTNVIIRSITQTPSSTASAADSSTSSAPSNGPGTGAVVGIVAAALVGVVVIASLLGYFFKAKCSGKDDDDIDDAVFDKNEFRRDSTMLPDDDGMSMRSGSVAGYHSNLSHSNSLGAGAMLPGLARGNTQGPRPPSILERHYLNAGSPAQANFPQQQQYQGAQVGQYFQQQPQYDQYGYPSSQLHPHNAAPVSNLDRQNSQASYYQDPRSGSANGHYNDTLGRSDSSATTNGAVVYPPSAQSERPLSEISEGGEDAFARSHNRTGTPEEHNPQYYFRHAANPSTGSASRSGSQNQLYGEDRRLSIRNPHDAAYGGSY